MEAKGLEKKQERNRGEGPGGRTSLDYKQDEPPPEAAGKVLGGMQTGGGAAPGRGGDAARAPEGSAAGRSARFSIHR